jgi:hypothetical protein
MSRAETLEEVLLQLIQSGLGATKAYSVVAELRQTPYMSPAATPPPATEAPKMRHAPLDDPDGKQLRADQAAWLAGGEGRHIHADSSAGGLEDAPEAGTMTGVPIDNSETWDWGPEDWIESYISQIAALRADLATVTSNHKQTLTALAVARDMMNESADELDTERAGYSLEMEDLANLLAGAKHDLAAEREARERTQEAHAILLQASSDALADEERHADGLYENLSVVKEVSREFPTWIDGDAISATLAAHDARRASEGGE